MQFENNLVLLRKQRNISQEELANQVGVSRQTIYSWESGFNYPNIIMLKKLAEVLNVTTDDLLNGFQINKLPKSFNDIKLINVTKHIGEVEYKEMPNWFIKASIGEEVCWGLYDLIKDKFEIDCSYYIEVTNEVVVHDVDGYEIQVKEYDNECNFVSKVIRYISITNQGAAWLGEQVVKEGKTIIQTYKDKAYLKDWGYDKKFIYQSTKFNDAYDAIMEFEGKKQKVVVISYFDPDGSNDEKMGYFETILNENFESLIWRRYRKKKYNLKDKMSGIEITIDGEIYDLDYYAVTSRL